MSHRDFLPNTTMQNVLEQMGPRDDAKAAWCAERWMDLIIEDSTVPEGAMALHRHECQHIAEYVLALGHLKELLAVHIDAALADMSGRPVTGKAIINVSYNPAHCYPESMGLGSQS
jgi:hypothetical protein